MPVKKGVKAEKPSTYKSVAQQGWANATHQEFSEKWNKQTKAAGKFKGLPDKVTPKGGK
jgi:hypothetical protein